MEQQLTQLTGALLVAIVALAYLALRAWRNHSLEQTRSLGQLPTPITHEDSVELDGSYVATTFGDQPLNRVKGLGLGMRGKATVEFSKRGVTIWRVGEVALHIPTGSIVGLDRATAVIDRAVEAAGLTRITWRISNQNLDTYVRFSRNSDQQRFIDETASNTIDAKNQGDQE